MANFLMTGEFAPSAAPLKGIEEIQFGIFSPEEVKGMSVCHVQYPETMDETRQRPRENGLADPRLGTMDRNLMCATCEEDQKNCPGHFGHIELAVPVFHVGYIRKIQKILEMVCHSCAKILLDESDPKFAEAMKVREPKRRFEAIYKVCHGKLVCEQSAPQEDEYGKEGKAVVMGHGGCGSVQPMLKRKGLEIKAKYKAVKGEEEEDSRQAEERTLFPQEALNIFRLIRDSDLRKLGLNTQFARPEWMIITVLPVPPLHVRPSVSADGTGQGMRSEDDLTFKLGDIIRANQNVRACETEGAPRHVVNEFQTLLQYHVATYMDNESAGTPKATQKSGRPIKSIRARLKGKEGRLRGNLMGKRVDFSARTVITGDPNLDLDEVGVPISTARILTYPETVTPFNIQKLTKFVENGPNVHPGAKYVFRHDGRRIDLKYNKSSGGIALQYGWKVERHLMNGDYVIFNRQPSLHKESMMGHRVRVMPYSTFRLNLSVTSPYNADFDGDEMNLHAPQSEETRAEINQLCMVPLNIVSPQGNKPLMGIVQDTLCGVYKLCRRDTFLTKEEVMNIMMWVPEWDGVIPPPAVIKPRPRWTGKQMISMALPSNLNLIRGGDLNPVGDDTLMVLHGELMYGLFAKPTVGASPGGVVHTIYNEKGWEAAVSFFNACQRIVCYWLLHNGFSIGIGDTVPSAEAIAAIQKAIATQKAEVEEVVKDATADNLEPLPGMNVRQTFESKVSRALNEARNLAGKATSANLKDINNAVQMSRSGSKGSDINISQMSALVGQQSVEGKRVPFGFNYRTLPHFTKDDYSPESRGFVENSYLRGLTPSEFFFHAMAGREGLIDTAVKTAETGYIQRRLVKALEDSTVKYDGTIRNSLGDIIQFIYGEDGLDAVYIEGQAIDVVTCSDAVFTKKLRIDVLDDPKLSLNKDQLEQADEIKGSAEVQRELDAEWEQLCKDREFLREICGDEEKVMLPLNIVRIIEQAKGKFRIKDGARSDLHPLKAIPKVRDMLSRLIIVRGEDQLSIEADESSTLLFKALLRSRLAFKRLVVEYSLSELALDNVLGEIENRFLRAAASPGEMVGVLAAQSIGEPATQMTLNTFHFTGIASKNVTLGVPRLKEILNVAENIKTPSMAIYQVPENKLSQESAKRLRSQIEHTTLRSVTDITEIYYDPDIQTSVVDADRDLVESYFMLPDDDIDPSTQSKWVLRIVLGRRKMLDKGLTVSDVAAKVREWFQAPVAVIYSDNNADEQVIRIRAVPDRGKAMDEAKMDDSEEDLFLRRCSEEMLNSVTLRGVSGVERAFIDQNLFVRVTENGEMKKAKGDPQCMEWFLNTTGTSLKECLHIDGVDATRTTSNSFMEILRTLGIEACRASLSRELHAVLSFDGSYVNYRHLAMLVDVMTARGFVMAITRHGINRTDTGALMRCSFEETVEILLEAAAIGEIDDCRGVSENVMLGQLAPVGTGEMQVFLHQEMLNTAASDNARFGLVQGMNASTAETGGDGHATPYNMGSPSHEGMSGGNFYADASFSPMIQPGGNEGGLTAYGGSIGDGSFSPFAPTSPGYATSPFGGTSPSSPSYSPTSPMSYSPTSPMGISSPQFAGMSPASPAYTPTSPQYSPTSPKFGGGTSPTSPSYSPASPNYSPTSPKFASGASPTSPAYSPTSPNFSYSPTSPALHATTPRYSPTSPTFSPTSPAYSPTSPAFDGGRATRRGGQASPTSPNFSPTSPTSPVYSPTSPMQQGAYSPTSPKYSPTSPAPNPYSASPRSPAYSPGSPRN